MKTGHLANEVAGCAIGSTRSGRPIIWMGFSASTVRSQRTASFVILTLESEAPGRVCFSAYLVVGPYAVWHAANGLERCRGFKQRASGIRRRNVSWEQICGAAGIGSHLDGLTDPKGAAYSHGLPSLLLVSVFAKRSGYRMSGYHSWRKGSAPPCKTTRGRTTRPSSPWRPRL
jgi:hypothetical protein